MSQNQEQTPELHVRWIEQIIGDGDYDTLTMPGYLDGVDA